MIFPSIDEIDRALEKKKLESSLFEYVKWSFFKKTGKQFIVNWHHERICDYLEKVYRHEITRLIINIPPRYSKTEIAVKAFIEWSLAKVADAKFIHLSYSDMLALDNSSQIREDLKSDWFQSHWKRETKIDSDSKSKWYTKEGGGLYATGTGGSITGFGAGNTNDTFGGAIVIDDPVKPLEVLSSDIRQKLNERLNNTIISRLNNPKKTPIIIIMQRLHESDMTGYCLDGGTGEKWEHLCIPILDENDTPLWEMKHDYHQLMIMKKASARIFAGQYMQAPAPEEGNIIQRSWLNYYSELPAKFDKMIMSWDMAFKESQNSDYVVGQVWGRVGGRFYLIDQVRDRMNFPSTLQSFKAMVLKYPQITGKFVEAKANGQAVIDSLKKEIYGIIAVNPQESKEARLSAISPLFEAGNVFLPANAPWIQDYAEELVTFPNAAHDDQVDSTSMALSNLMGGHACLSGFNLISMTQKSKWKI